MPKHSIQVRPNAGNGLWLGFILPLAIIFGIIKHNIESSELYQYNVLVSLGILYITIVFISTYSKSETISVDYKYFIFANIIISTIFYILSNEGLTFSCYGAFISTFIFYRIFLFILKNFPLCFTVGEALFCAQGTTMFFYSATIFLSHSVHVPPKTVLQISTLIIQVGLSYVAVICFLTSKYRYFMVAKNFYIMIMSTFIFGLLVPLHLLLRRSPLIWMYELFTKDIATVMMLLYWMTCSTCAAIAVNRQIKGARRASTSIRKIFHILAVLVYLPGLLYECSIIYLASGVTLGIFAILEVLRHLNIPPLGSALQDGFMVFSDEKDIGSVALTPMYLLVGCSLPLWLHPSPCDLTNSAGFNLLPLLSGLLSIGVGDTLASYVGSHIGRHKWSGSDKTIEGTLGCILGQLLFVYLLFYFGFINLQDYDVVKVLIAVITVSLVEAKTNQVDNLVLPLLMYIILL